MSDEQKEILRALKFHTELLTLVLTTQNVIQARLDVIAALQRQLAKHSGIAPAEIDDLLKRTFDNSLLKLEATLHKSVSEIQATLPASGESGESKNN